MDDQDEPITSDNNNIGLNRIGGNRIINNGCLIVDGDCRLQNLDHERISARLFILDRADYILVKGDFAKQSWSSDQKNLEEGVLDVLVYSGVNDQGAKNPGLF